MGEMSSGSVIAVLRKYKRLELTVLALDHPVVIMKMMFVVQRRHEISIALTAMMVVQHETFWRRGLLLLMKKIGMLKGKTRCRRLTKRRKKHWSEIALFVVEEKDL